MKFQKAMKIYAQYDKNQKCDMPLTGKGSITNSILSLQDDVRNLKNASLRMSYDYDRAQSDYLKFINEQKEKLSSPIEMPTASSADFSKYKTFDGYIYDVLHHDYKNLASGIIASATRRIWGTYKQDKKEIVRGEKSLRTFGKDQPIPVPAACCKLTYEDDLDYVLSLGLFSDNMRRLAGMDRGGVRFILDDKDDYQRAILNRLLSGEYKLCECQLAYDHAVNRRTKKARGWYIMVGYAFEKETDNPALDKDKILGVDLGIVNVLYLASSVDKYFKKYIPGSQIQNFKRKEQKRKSDLQRSCVVRGDGSRGHGRACAVRPAEKQGEYIKNFQDNANWNYAHFVVDNAIEQGCGTIQMEDLSGISKDDKQNKMLSHWAFYDLQLKISNLAAENGIEVRKIRPAYTSQRCSECGYIDKNNRKIQAVFQCQRCGFKKNADFNAARNIAIRDIDYIIEEQIKADKAA